MSEFDPIVTLDHDGNAYRVTMGYTEGMINEMARRAMRELDEKVIERIGFAKVVRCRDCKWCMAYSEATYCDRFAHALPSMEPDGYCAWGERETDA